MAQCLPIVLLERGCRRVMGAAELWVLLRCMSVCDKEQGYCGHSQVQPIGNGWQPACKGKPFLMWTCWSLGISWRRDLIELIYLSFQTAFDTVIH